MDYRLVSHLAFLALSYKASVYEIIYRFGSSYMTIGYSYGFVGYVDVPCMETESENR